MMVTPRWIEAMVKKKISTIDEADAALEADLQALEEKLRSERPDLFDESGRFLEARAQRELERRAAAIKATQHRESVAVTTQQVCRSSDAP